jgi:hypothetical protein
MHKVIWIIWYHYKHFHSFVKVAQRVLKYCIHNKIPFGWQSHQVVCRPTQCLSSILIWLTTKTAKTIFKARTYRWVHAVGVNVFCLVFAVLRLFFSLNKFHGLPRLNEVWSLHLYWSCLDVNGSTQFPSRCNPCSLLFYLVCMYCWSSVL